MQYLLLKGEQIACKQPLLDRLETNKANKNIMWYNTKLLLGTSLFASNKFWKTFKINLLNIKK